MKICLVASRYLEGPLRELGHEVLLLSPPLDGAPFFDLPRALAEARFAPELVVHQENLSHRVLCTGLEEVACPKIFWSLDTHLNAWWVTDYGRCFDGVLTTQPDWVGYLRAAGLSRVGVLSWFGARLPFSPHDGRDVPVAFVGRLSPARLPRTWMTGMLAARFAARIESDIPVAEVLPLYCRTRVAPNESILGEINIRLFETASAGCCVVGQDLGGAQAAFFEPGREMLLYRDGLELAAVVERLRNDPAQSERLGRAAWARVQAEHLPVHRAHGLLDFAKGLAAGGAATGEEARRAFWCAAARLALAGRLPLRPAACEEPLALLAAGPEPAGLLLRLLLAREEHEGVTRLLAESLARGAHAGNVEFDLTASTAALRLGEKGTARLFLMRHLEATGMQAEQGGHDRPHAHHHAHHHVPQHVPHDPPGLLKAWARLLHGQGRTATPGISFDPERDVPASASECLAWALSLDETDMESARLLDLWLEPVPGMEGLRLGWLSMLALHERADWRHPLRLGLLNLRCFRLEEGIGELAQARDLAAAAGRARLFAAAVAAADTTGAIRQALGLPG
ncbi:hypothetical protein dsx2_1035 [Desulfovibrio sp. X2]|uniref:glycosyltransferase family protein n=1 Tax=Desulfovibrio sp. X2 TaxID=941449 RepID=UPI000358E88A|nr:glycosyltransferase [Desulfovibrio sp. X2]EPR37092.1 hypothetical protein dsx2_1035 [Desulfovibrio sp. X2]